MYIMVIGAGVAGLAAALELSLRGFEVEVMEQASNFGAQSCSWIAGGMLSPYAELESAEPAITQMGEAALAWWARHFPGTVQNGSLVVAPPRDIAELSRFAARTKNFRWVEGDELAQLEPALAERFSKALFFESEGHLDPRAALVALARELQKRGVQVQFNSIAHPRESGGPEVSLDSRFRGNERRKSDFVVDCRGLAARDELKDLRGVKGEMVLVKTGEIELNRPVRLAHPRTPFYIVPRGEGLFMVGATAIESEDRTMSARSLVELLSCAYAVHPAFAEAEVLEFAADLRPAFPDNLPRIERRGKTIFINGLYRHGFLAAPALAIKAADMIAAELNHADQHQRRSA